MFSEILERRTMLAAHPATTIKPTRGGDGAPAPITLGIWHTYAQATSDLQSIAAQYPTLTRLSSIGKTVQNRDIWAMEITDNAGTDEDEPEFYYQGSMHGDEPVGMENCFYFMNELLTKYGSDQRLTNLVNNMDIWIVPNMNWDGYSWPTGARRGNANNVDLNRNFPEWTTRSFSSDTKYFGPFGNNFDGPPPQTALLQPETVAMMNFYRQHNFVASANFHTGDLVVNYPWDTNGNTIADYATAPDDGLFRQISLKYSLNNPPMSTSPGFNQGTTNGDNWYPISGGLQDWGYIYTGTDDVTIELNTTKYPSASQIPTLWNNNKESMLQFMEAANWGVRGVVTRAGSGTPLFAKVTVIAPAPSPTPDPNHPSTHLVFTDPDVGDYHRQLLPGTYTLKFEAPGYVTQTISNVVVGSNTNDPTATARLNVSLVPIDNTPPTVLNGAFHFETNPMTITFGFDEHVLVEQRSLELENLTLGTEIDDSTFGVSYNSTSNVATFTLPALPSGYYEARTDGRRIFDDAGNQLLVELAFKFIYVAGSNGNDAVYARRDSGGNQLQVWINANPATDPASISGQFTTLANFDVDGNGGDDSLTLDFGNGEVRPNPSGGNLVGGGFDFRLGSGNETLRLIGPINASFSSDPATQTPNLALVLDGASNITFAGSGATHLAGLTVNDGAFATLAAGNARVLVTGNLSRSGTGKLDLNDNDLIVFYSGASALPSIQGWINSARAGGSWSGNGITSTAAAAPPRITTLGAMEASDFKSIYGSSAQFDGQALSGNAVIVKYTYYGDADFNGKVNFDDYSRIDAGFNAGRSGWLHGDFDGNGRINFDDYSLIDQAFNAQGLPL